MKETKKFFYPHWREKEQFMYNYVEKAKGADTMKEYEERIVLDNFIKERIRENEEIFTKKELAKASEEFILIKKIYLLGLINGSDIYK